jgi:hypothetical protein
MAIDGKRIRGIAPGTDHGTLGTAVEPTDAEREKGVIASFEGKDGTRSTIAVQ